MSHGYEKVIVEVLHRYIGAGCSEIMVLTSFDFQSPRFPVIRIVFWSNFGIS